MRSCALLLLLATAVEAQFFPFPGPGNPPAGGGSGYLHHRTLTIDHTQVGGSALTNFPVLVQATLGAAVVQNASCFDVIFTSDSGGTTKVPWQMESCSQSTGVLIAWVSVASVSSSVDTVFYVQYDNAAITTAQNTGGNAPTAVWPAAYKSVYHFGTATTLSLLDSTSNAANLTNLNSTAPGAGQIGGGPAFSGASMQLLENGGVITVPASSDLTISLWINTAAGSTNRLFNWGNGGQGVFGPYTDNTFYWDDGSRVTTAYSAFYSAWHYVVVTCKANASGQSIIIDGVSKVNTAGACYTGTLSSFSMSARGTNYSIDEVRMQFAVDANVVGISLAEYNSQKSGSTFLTVGGEV